MMKALYTHPEGAGLQYDPASHCITATDGEGSSVNIPIGPLKLAELASSIEQASAAGTDIDAIYCILHDCLTGLYVADTRSQAEHDVQRAISDVLASFDRETAAAGLAIALVPTLIQGIASEPFIGSMPGDLVVNTAKTLNDWHAEASRSVLNGTVPF